MKKKLLVVVVAGFMLSTVSPVFAIKQLKDAFGAQYANEKADPEFKKLVEQANCNVCHIDKENKKKVRNPYGDTLQKALVKDEFPVKEFGRDPAKFADRLNDIFKKVEAEKSGDEAHKTFADRMQSKLLPGGNVLGKKE